MNTFFISFNYASRKLDEERRQFSIDYYRLDTFSCYHLLSEAKAVTLVTKWRSPDLKKKL
jgi:hypothetical protein